MALYLACAVFGGVLLLLQLAGGLAGADGHPAGDAGHLDAGHLDADHVTADHAVHGWHPIVQLASLRALAAMVAGFGIAGAGLRAAGTGGTAALIGAIAIGLAAGAAVSALTRALLRFESDGTVQLARAVGLPATVYVSIPRAGGGAGKVQLALQGRLVECAAVTSDDAPLATGAPVLVVDVADGDTLVVSTDPAPPPER